MNATHNKKLQKYNVIGNFFRDYFSFTFRNQLTKAFMANFKNVDIVKGNKFHNPIGDGVLGLAPIGDKTLKR